MYAHLTQKTKQKLGKGKQLQSNATDTSFKAKTIALPQQSVSVDRSQSLTTRRNQTLADLVQNSRHHSPGMRKDAVNGMLELISTYPVLVEQETPTLLNTVLPIIGDDDPQVRSAVATYFGALSESLSLSQFSPYIASILLFVTSAMSHITMPVRLDALRILDLLLKKAGAAVTHGWEGAVNKETQIGDAHGQRVLQAFFAMIGVAGDAAAARQGAPTAKMGSTASVELQPNDRLRVLRALSRFMAVATHTDTGTVLPLWCFQAAFTSASDREHFERLFVEQIATALVPDMPWIESSMVEFGALPLMSVTDALIEGASVRGEARAQISAHERLSQLLHASLLATLLDSMPAALSPEGPSNNVHLDLVAEILSISAALWREIVTQHIAACAARGVRTPIHALPQLQQLLSHLAPYFPVTFSGDNTSLLRLNAVYCELVALSAIAHTEEESKKKQGMQLAQHMDRTLEYLAALLAEGGEALTPELYLSLIPTLWLLLSSPHAKTMIEPLLRHYMDLPTSSPLKPIAFEFLARLALLHTYVSLRVSLDAVHAARDVWQEWLISLPRTLWEAATHSISRSKSAEVKTQNHALATNILQLLQAVLVQSDGVLFERATLDGLTSPLRPFFSIQHPTRGMIPGPYHRLPDASKAMARALAHRTELDVTL